MLRSLSKSFVWGGLAAIAVGAVSIVWPGITLAVVAALFAIVAFVGAARQFERAFSSATAGPVAGHALLGIISAGAGVGTLVWPGITVLVLAIWIGVWALVMGAGEFGLAFTSRETAGERALFGFGGLLGIAFGLVLLVRPDLGAVTLAEVFGLYSLAYGIWSVVMGASTHSVATRIDAFRRGA